MTTATTHLNALQNRSSDVSAPPVGPRPDLGPAGLATRARELADHPDEWLHRVRLSADGRWYERVHLDEDVEVWLISWLPGQSTGFHDHGEASGAFSVVLGTLEERGLASTRSLGSGQTREFGPRYVHDVRNTSTAPAVSVHVYSPPLTTMRRFDLAEDGRLVQLATESAEDW
ncbi:MAG: putative cysteine dioxygenase [Streptosporangiaceae bacterium]|jgi:predicted metal-dependent enzyme (double-stranded beta helix superfamily)|nr:putative cysteine dioxygenase [Streptosporangiaceae bacterium]